jgi:hypothetical protein
MNLPTDIPAEAVPFLEEVGYLEPDRLSLGDPAPDVPLYTPDGETSLSRLRDGRPAVLIFGSYT